MYNFQNLSFKNSEKIKKSTITKFFHVEYYIINTMIFVLLYICLYIYLILFYNIIFHIQKNYNI